MPRCGEATSSLYRLGIVQRLCRSPSPQLLHATFHALVREITRDCLDPVAITTYDWVHTLLQHGCFIIEMEAMLVAAAGSGVTRAGIQKFLQNDSWRFPNAFGVKSRSLHRIFDEKRRSGTDRDKIKCSCSEALGVYGILRCQIASNCVRFYRSSPQCISTSALVMHGAQTKWYWRLFELRQRIQFS